MPSIHDVEFSAAVRAGLKEAQVAERTLSKILGITQASLSAKMNGRTGWTLCQRNTALDFLGAFGISIPTQKLDLKRDSSFLLDGARRDKELSRAELADAAGISLGKLTSMEAGNDPFLSDAVAVATVLGRPLDALFPASFAKRRSPPKLASLTRHPPPPVALQPDPPTLDSPPASPQASPEERSDAELDSDLDFFVDKKSSFVNTGGRRQQ